MATASAGEVKKSATSYGVEKGLAGIIANSGADGQNVPFLDGLLALKTLKDLSPAGAAGAESRRLFQGLIDNETRMLKVAAHTLANNKALSEKLGNTLQSVMAMASVLKQKRNDLVYDQILTNAVSGGAFGLTSPDARRLEINESDARRNIRVAQAAIGEGLVAPTAAGRNVGLRNA